MFFGRTSSGQPCHFLLALFQTFDVDRFFLNSRGDMFWDLIGSFAMGAEEGVDKWNQVRPSHCNLMSSCTLEATSKITATDLQNNYMSGTGCP